MSLLIVFSTPLLISDTIVFLRFPVLELLLKLPSGVFKHNGILYVWSPHSHTDVRHDKKPIYLDLDMINHSLFSLTFFVVFVSHTIEDSRNLLACSYFESPCS